MENVKVIINNVVLKQECAHIMESFYDSFTSFYLLPVIQSVDNILQPLVRDSFGWSNHLLNMGYHNTRQLTRREYRIGINGDFKLNFFLVKQTEDLSQSLEYMQEFLEKKLETLLLNNTEENYLLMTVEVPLEQSVEPIQIRLNNAYMKGNLLVIEDKHKKTLPALWLPTAFVQWKDLESTRPYYLEPVHKIEQQPPGINPRVVSSVDGKIKTLVLFYASLQEGEEKRVYCYSDFLIELIERIGSNSRRFIIAVEDHHTLPKKLEKQLVETAKKAGHQLEIVYVQYRKRFLTAWVQDVFLPIQFEKDGATHTYLVESTINYHYSNSIKALDEAHPNMQEFTHYRSSLPFVGGNVLSGDGFLLIGLHHSNKELLDKMGSDWIGNNYIPLSSKPTPYIQGWGNVKKTASDGVLNYYLATAKDQTLFHLDLFITLGGKGLRRNTLEYIVIGEPVIGFDGIEQAPEDVQEMVQKLLAETGEAIEEMIEQIKEGLKRLDIRCKIIRNPLPLVYYDQREKNRQGNFIRKRYWAWATYNNALVERYKNTYGEEVRRVILPSYGQNSDYSQFSGESIRKFGNWKYLKKFDEANKRIWEKKLHYQVVLLQQDFNPFIRYQGSLNCLTNCIERTLEDKNEQIDIVLHQNFTKMTDFNSMEFDVANKTLSILGENNVSLQSYNLSTTAVKLSVTRQTSGQLQVTTSTGAIGSFSSSSMELKLKFSGTNQYTSVSFGEPAEGVEVEIDGDTAEICKTGEFCALIVGSDDIRNNRASANVLLMEGETLSFEIDTTADLFIVRYHST